MKSSVRLLSLIPVIICTCVCTGCQSNKAIPRSTPHFTHVTYFNARTYGVANVDRSKSRRLSMLEFLIIPKSGGKSYECLAYMEKDVWEAFLTMFEEGDTMLLRWTTGKHKIIEIPVTEIFPWAKPRKIPHGIELGRNHDERFNPRLPPNNTPIQIGIMRQ